MITATKRIFKQLLVALVAVFFLVFSAVNRGIVHLSLFPLPYYAEMPLFLFAMFCFTLGLMVGWALVSLKLTKSQRLLKSEHKHVMALQNEVAVRAAKQETLPAVK